MKKTIRFAKGQNEAYELQTYEYLGKCVTRLQIDAKTTPPTPGVSKGSWVFIAATYNGTAAKMYENGELKSTTNFNIDIPTTPDDLIIGDWTPTLGRGFNGTIDEVMLFNYSLSEEQVKAIYNNKRDLIVSQETTPGEEYFCSVTPNDGFDDGNVLNSSSLMVKWKIMFNVTSGEFDIGDLDNVLIYGCTYPGFNQAGDTTNMYGPYGFPDGTWTCSFYKINYFNKTEIFEVDNDKIINVVMQKKGALTDQEHTWLEALYNCIILKDCDLYNLLVQINTTVTNIWEHTRPTDQSVVTTENLISNTANSTHNITYEYTIKIPNKAGYAVNTYLPIRIGYWFINKNTGKCYSQGNPPSGIELIEPYCQPWMIETIGPMGGSVSFGVDLRPSNLTAGTYNITRSVEIDPNNIWNNYGQEFIGEIGVTEDLPINSGGISTKTTSVSEVKTTEVIIQQSSGGGGGSSGSNNPSITNVYNIYNVGESKEATEGKEKGNDETDSKGLTKITGAIVADLSKASPLVGSLIIIIIIIIGLISYFFIKKKE